MPGHEPRIGTSGWVYPGWRGVFYPADLPRRRELEYLAQRLNSVEINGSFYSLQRPERFRRWSAATPDDFLFAVKGGRFITHLKRLRDVKAALANFFASGVLALEDKLGPVLWQLPPHFPFDAERLEEFFALLPRTTTDAAELARRHDDKIAFEPLTEAWADRPLRHALEVRDPSFADPACPRLLRRHGIALVVADTAGRWPYLDEVTTDFVYVRLHGDVELYAGGYGDRALTAWAERVRAWRDTGLACHVYFDNDMKVRAPGDAMALAERVRVTPPSP